MYRVAAVGGVARAYLAMLHPETNLVGVCDVREDQRTAGKRLCDHQRAWMKPVKPDQGPVHFYADYRTMLDKEKPDLVLIATPDRLHASMTVATLERGAHVWVEKPMCLTLEECAAMVEAARKHKRKVAVNQSVRTTNTLQRILQLRADGRLGTPYYAKANYLHHKDPRVERQDENNINASNPLFPFGSHAIDTVLGVIGDVPEAVTCYAAKKRTSRAYAHPDTMSVHMRFSKGRIGYSLTTAASRRSGGFQIEVYGTKMDVVLDRNVYGDPVVIPDIGFETTPVCMHFFSGRRKRETINFLDYPHGHVASFYRTIEHLIYAMDHDVKSPAMVDVVDGAHVVTVALAAVASAEAGGEPAAPERFDPLPYRGTAAPMREEDYMQGFIRSHYLHRPQQRAIARGERV